MDPIDDRWLVAISLALMVIMAIAVVAVSDLTTLIAFTVMSIPITLVVAMIEITKLLNNYD